MQTSVSTDLTPHSQSLSRPDETSPQPSSEASSDPIPDRPPDAAYPPPNNEQPSTNTAQPPLSSGTSPQTLSETTPEAIPDRPPHTEISPLTNNELQLLNPQAPQRPTLLIRRPKKPVVIDSSIGTLVLRTPEEEIEFQTCESIVREGWRRSPEPGSHS